MEHFTGESESRPALEIVSRRPARGARRHLLWACAGFAVIVAVLGSVYLIKRSREPHNATSQTIRTETGEMVLVPAGVFHYGPSGATASAPAFYIDRTEVTNAAYERFCRETGHKLPPEFSNDRGAYPVVNVSPEDAAAFASWAGKRLPTGLEWEKAARGPDGYAFPWGAALDRSRAAIALGQPVLANAFTNGASPYGALQMAGNVWEIVDDKSGPSPQSLERFSLLLQPPPGPHELFYSIRGGAFDSPELTPQILWRYDSVPARWKATDLGFRCARSVN